MCGIVGYVGERDCTDVLLDSLSKLEYRGYDSAGIAVFENGEITVLWLFTSFKINPNCAFSSVSSQIEAVFPWFSSLI